MDRAARYEYLGPAFHAPASLLRMAATKSSFHAPRSPAATSTTPPHLAPEPAGPRWKSMVMNMARVQTSGCEMVNR